MLSDLFVYVPAGEYLLGVNTVEGWHRREDFPPTFYPGAPSAAQAKIVRLKDAAKLAGYNLSVTRKVAK